MKIFNVKQFGIDEILNQLRAQRSRAEDVRAAVLQILEDVKKRGDKALFELTKKFDGVELKSLAVSEKEIQAAYKNVDEELLEAMKEAARNIRKFQAKTVVSKEKSVETEKGVKVWREFRPIEKVGLYVPGGLAPYPSTVLMLGIPAQIAGCKEVTMCTPALRDGSVNSAILVAADLCGIKRIFKIGGAQAIAAMAYGTETVGKVSKIFGPGNQYVSTAKILVYGEVDIDMPAGPSEIAVVADEDSNPAWIAADLLSQLEHGGDSQALLVTFSEQFAESVMLEMREQMKRLSRSKIIEASFDRSAAVVVSSCDEACEIINEYAPEHLEIISKYEAQILKNVNNVGSVFLGKYSSEPLGDYVTGSNHTLPTSGFAKMFPPLSPESFGKMIQVQKVSKKGIAALRKTAEVMATAEGLDAHRNSVTIRFI